VIRLRGWGTYNADFRRFVVTFLLDQGKLLKDQLECLKNNRKETVSACSAVLPLVNLPIKFTSGFVVQTGLNIREYRLDV
tara:strand:- start:399 stop:638 length:240 start_codon:yes stop_codon:yes gene_type:complete